MNNLEETIDKSKFSSVRNDVCSFHNLYVSTQKCRKNVNWKDSVAHFANHSLVNVYKLKKTLENNSYKISPYSVFQISEPKVRKITSTRFKDRVFQRSLCDNYVTKQITQYFIPSNFACQKNKGTDKAREYLKFMLKEFYKQNGLKGYWLKCDIHDYFGSTQHSLAKNEVRKRIKDDWAYENVAKIIDSFDKEGDYTKGIGLGSQVSQLIQLAVLDDLDHYITETLHIELYVRYMDDFILLCTSKHYLKTCLIKIDRFLRARKLELNSKKTYISAMGKSIKFLGFSYLLHDSGKVTLKILKEKVNHERRKLKRQIHRVEQNKLSIQDFESCYKSWRAHANKSNSRGIVLKMDKYKEKLKNEIRSN